MAIMAMHGRGRWAVPGSPEASTAQQQQQQQQGSRRQRAAAAAADSAAAAAAAAAFKLTGRLACRAFFGREYPL